MHRHLIQLFGGILLLVAFHTANAQLFSFNTALKLRPETPGSHTAVSATLEGYGVDLNNSYITWTLNGKIIQKGIGNKQISFTTGEIGSSYDLGATIVQQDGSEANLSAFFRVGDVDLLWHANEYAPPYYLGKALIAKKGEVVVTAVPYLYNPGGQKIPSSNLIYTWKIDDRNAITSSGFNKPSFTFEVDGVIKHSHVIEVAVSDLQKTTRTTKSIILTPGNQEILIYENHPLSGPAYQKAITDFHTSPGLEHQFIAAPFHFTIETGLEQLNYKWTINGVEETDKASKDFFFNFRSLSGAVGELIINARIENKKSPFQISLTDFQIKVE